MELADSITLDQHKWLYQPYQCGCLLVRRGHLLREAFQITPDYLRDVETVDQEVNSSDLGIQLTRACRALKVWLSLKYFGTDAFRTAIDRSLDLAHRAQGGSKRATGWSCSTRQRWASSASAVASPGWTTRTKSRG